MSENIKFSIVIPIYNRENNLNNCIKDIISQQYNNIEIILVNDASSDSSGKMCDSFANTYKNIKVIHHTKNKGASTSRNDGLEIATGDYILFLDSDDRYEPTLLHKLEHTIVESNPDIVVYSLLEEYYNEKQEQIYSYAHSRPNSILTDRIKIGKEIAQLEKETMYGYPWNKAYKLSYLIEHNVRFKAIDHVEDILFNIDAFDNISKLVVLEDKLYHYVNQVSNRLTDKYLPNYFELQKTRIIEFYKQQENFKTLDKNTLSIISGEYFRWLLSAVEREYDHKTSKDKIKDLLETEFSSSLFNELQKNFHCSKKLKILYKPLINKNAKETLLYVRLISNVKRRIPNLFSKLKQNR